MVLQHNMAALNCNRTLGVSSKRKSKSTEKLSTGYKINRAADNAAGLTISEGMRAMIRGLDAASKNGQDGMSLLQTADGALNEVHSTLQRIRELSVQAANDVNTEEDREAIQKEVDELLAEVNRIADDTEFNTMKLLDGSLKEDAAGSPFKAHNKTTGVFIKSDGVQSVKGGFVSADPVRKQSAIDAVGDVAYLTDVEDELQNNMVPKAVGAIVDTFKSTFGSNSNISKGIGVSLYADNSSTLAYVACSYSYDSSGKISGMKLNLSVNVKSLEFDKTTKKLTEESNKALQATIAHEMMHAFMDDALPNGMLGATNGVVDKENKFPKWFVEGMAQTVAGGCSNYNDWVNGGLGLNANSTMEQISAAIKSSGNKLISNSTASQYGTGYLACMYLGYLASGGNAVSSQAIGSGLDTILSSLKNGKNFNEVIAEISNGKYTSINDFQSKFGDMDSANFVSGLLKGAGAAGSGSVVANSLGDKDVLANATPNNNYYKPDLQNEYVASNATTFTDGGGGGYFTSAESKGGLNLQIGARSNQAMKVTIDDTHTEYLGLSQLSMMSHEEASGGLKDIDKAIEQVSENRSRIGAYMNRLEYAIANLDNTSENTQAAESRIRDTDMAEEMVRYSASSILEQAGQSLLAQANQSTQGILTLLQ